MKTFILTLSPQQLQVVAACLAKQPYEAVAETIHAIQAQVQEQEKASSAPSDVLSD